MRCLANSDTEVLVGGTAFVCGQTYQLLTVVELKIINSDIRGDESLINRHFLDEKAFVTIYGDVCAVSGVAAGVDTKLPADGWHRETTDCAIDG
jgi:hypothetical protein